MLKCKDLSRLVAADQIEDFSFMQRMELKFHLFMCRYCARYRKQLLVLREICRQRLDDDTTDPSVVLPPEACDRIKASLKSRDAQPQSPPSKQ